MFDDIKIVWPLNEPFSSTAVVNSGTTASINRGEPTRLAGGPGAVQIMVDGEGTTGTYVSCFTGIAKSASTETSTAAGSVILWLPLPGVIYSGVAKSSTAADSQSEIDALYGKRVVFDLTSSTWTVDTAATNDTANALVIVGGDYRTNTVYFAYATSGALIL